MDTDGLSGTSDLKNMSGKAAGPLMPWCVNRICSSLAVRSTWTSKARSQLVRFGSMFDTVQITSNHHMCHSYIDVNRCCRPSEWITGKDMAATAHSLSQANAKLMFPMDAATCNREQRAVVKWFAPKRTLYWLFYRYTYTYEKYRYVTLTYII